METHHHLSRKQPPSKLNKQLANVIKIAVFFGLGILLVWLAIRNLTPQQKTDIVDAFKSANYFWLFATMVIGIISHVSRSIRWNMLLRPMGYNPRLINTFCAVMVGYLVNFGIPRGGEVTRCGILSRYEKIPLQKVIGTMVTERAIDVLLLLVVFVIGFFVEFDKLNDFVQKEVFSRFEAKFAPLAHNAYLLALVGVILISMVFIAWRLRHFVRNLKLYHTLKGFVKGFWDGVRAVGNLESPLLFIAHSIFIWLMYFLAVYVGFFCLPQTSQLGLGAALSVLAIGSIAMMVTPGGFGAYPLFVAKIMLIYQVGEAIGQASGWLNWGGQFVSILLVGLAALIVLPAVNNPKKQEGGAEQITTI